MAIHPTAIVDPAAELDSSVEVGAYSLIGPHVKIGAGTKVGPHVVIEGHTTIGRDNTFFQFGSIGAANQDKKYACLLYTSPSPRDLSTSRMPSSA